jgi:hypothetical protein
LTCKYNASQGCKLIYIYFFRTLTTEPDSEVPNHEDLDVSTIIHVPSSDDAVLIDVITEDGRKTFAVFEMRDPPYQLRHSDIPWKEGFSNSIPSMRLHYQARIIPDVVRTLGHAFHTWLMIVLICCNLVYHPNESRSEPPMLVYPFRFSSKKRADVALEFLCSTWLPQNMYHVHLNIPEHMLAFGYRQDTVGHWPI